MAVREKLPAAALAVLLASLCGLGILLWLGRRQFAEMERRLDTAEKGVQAAHERILRYFEELKAARNEARSARQEADAAQQEARDLERALRASESEAEAARLESEQARSKLTDARTQAETAQLESEQARAEIERFRKQREAELNLMHEALSKVALTRRTNTGMVVELGQDSFRFDFDKAELWPENREILSRIAGILLTSSGYRLFIYGHTDDIGTDEYNQNLSERRANAVRDYLVQAGIPAELITTQGFGRSSPRVNQKTSEARARNRRVEIGIVDTLIEYEKKPKGL
jgi:outer membrane protein OmpA-like peptidoglycan-associated protein